MLGKSAAEGAKGLVEPGRVGDFGRLWTAGPLAGRVCLAWGISPTLQVEKGVRTVRFAPRDPPSPLTPNQTVELGKSVERRENAQTFQDEAEHSTLELGEVFPQSNGCNQLTGNLSQVPSYHHAVSAHFPGCQQLVASRAAVPYTEMAPSKGCLSGSILLPHP